MKILIKTKLADKDDIELDQHCLTADFIEWSFEKSLKNLGVRSNRHLLLAQS